MVRMKKIESIRKLEMERDGNITSKLHTSTIYRYLQLHSSEHEL